jgi:glucose dehydrogenase
MTWWRTWQSCGGSREAFPGGRRPRAGAGRSGGSGAGFFRTSSGAAEEPGSWLTYSGAYDGRRFSKLDQITPQNVSKLRPRWVYQVEDSGQLETTPLVADGVMYVTEPEARVTALDVKSGRRLWTWQHVMPKDVLAIVGRTNRGVRCWAKRLLGP